LNNHYVQDKIVHVLYVIKKKVFLNIKPNLFSIILQIILIFGYWKY